MALQKWKSPVSMIFIENKHVKIHVDNLIYNLHTLLSDTCFHMRQIKIQCYSSTIQ